MRLTLLPLLIMALANTVACGQVAPDAAEAVRPAFDHFAVTIEPFGLSPSAQVEQLRIDSTGRCWYTVKGIAATPTTAAQPGAVFDHRLSSDRTRRLNQLLEKTEWLAAAGAEGRAPQLHASTIRLTLTRAGAERSVICVGDRPAPYAALLHELQGIAIQERRIYHHDYLSGRIGTDAWQDVGRELAALRGEPYAKSPWHIEYERYLPIAHRILRDFHSQPDEQLVPAIRLAGHLHARSELKFLHRMADDRSSAVRKEVAWTLGRLHDDTSLPVLSAMMSAAGTTRDVGFELIRWGDAAVPRIVSLIEQSTDAALDGRDRTTGEDMVRAYIDRWASVPRPIDPAVVTAVRQALKAKDPANGLIRTTYHVEFLKLVAAD